MCTTPIHVFPFQYINVLTVVTCHVYSIYADVVLVWTAMLACLQIVFKNDKDSGKVFYVLKEDYEKKRCNGTSDTSIGMHKLCS